MLEEWFALHAMSVLFPGCLCFVCTVMPWVVRRFNCQTATKSEPVQAPGQLGQQDDYDNDDLTRLDMIVLDWDEKNNTLIERIANMIQMTTVRFLTLKNDAFRQRNKDSLIWNKLTMNQYLSQDPPIALPAIPDVPPLVPAAGPMVLVGLNVHQDQIGGVLVPPLVPAAGPMVLVGLNVHQDQIGGVLVPPLVPADDPMVLVDLDVGMDHASFIRMPEGMFSVICLRDGKKGKRPAEGPLDGNGLKKAKSDSNEEAISILRLCGGR